jgi:hypothetical protein
MAALDEALITRLLANNDVVKQFPILAAARKRLAEIGNQRQAPASSGCCGAPSAAAPSNTLQIRGVLSELKRSVAGLSGKSQEDFLRVTGHKTLTVVYNNGKAVKTVVLGS